VLVVVLPARLHLRPCSQILEADFRSVGSKKRHIDQLGTPRFLAGSQEAPDFRQGVSIGFEGEKNRSFHAACISCDQANVRPPNQWCSSSRSPVQTAITPKA